MDIKEVSIKGYQCPKCGKIFTQKIAAELCCKEYFCDICGKSTNQYITRCSECQEKERFKKAKKITEKEWNNLYPDYMIWWGNKYYYSIEEFLESYDEDYNYVLESERGNKPKYVWATYQLPIEVNADNALISPVEDACVDDESFDFDEDGKKEFYDFCKQWNKKYGKYVYEVDFNIAIMLDGDN